MLTSLQGAFKDKFPALVQQLGSILDGSLYIPPSERANGSEEAGGKRQKIQKAVNAGRLFDDPLLDRHWTILAACNPQTNGQPSPSLLRRAQLRAVENLFFSTTSLLQPTRGIFEITASYLDIQDLCRSAVCSTELNYELSLPNRRIWQAVSGTFALSEEIFWPEYSKKQTRINIELLGRVNLTFHECCTAPALKSLMLTYSKRPQLPDTTVWMRDRRAFFRSEIRPTVAAIAQNNRADATIPACEYLGGLVRTGKTGGFDLPLHVFDMFFVCGERQIQPAIATLVATAENFRNDNNISVSEVLTGAKMLLKSDGDRNLAYQALDRLTRYGDISEDLYTFQRYFAFLGKQSLLRLTSHLIARDKKPVPSLLFAAAYQGMPELIEPLINKGAKIAVGDFGPFFNNLVINSRSITAKFILDIIDQLLHKGIDKPDDQEIDLSSLFDNFPANCINALLCGIAEIDESDELMQKVISFGLKPVNSLKQTNTLRFALEKDRMRKIFQESPERYYDIIARLHRHGAKPPADVESLIEELCSSNPLMREKLLKLLWLPYQLATGFME